jgi:hypothetical protein
MEMVGCFGRIQFKKKKGVIYHLQGREKRMQILLNMIGINSGFILALTALMMAT